MLQQFREITTFVFDVDGVLTDGGLWLFDDGQQVRRMHIKDGYALQLAVKRGYRVMVISGAKSEAVRLRLTRLGITEVHMGVENKLALLQEYRKANNLVWKEIMYMGDDVPDIEVMMEAGIACAPADAAPEIRKIAAYISPLNGGYGCVRQIIEKVMKLRGDWTQDTSVPSK
ncbi:KdsC family phosphatase [Flavihumibacter petaseus]|uniref:3-deoxy-D-manno-octulosonate 8-phosphate phosphatase n=1 Tax=Flavihumibacter petaseus NBRC 106054 TaxID=1220578 RepID=A0A0E9N697_9BACT|nr:HAD hydrolase family protein [Flavihumibacter petaseus]GAO45333.1 3-deoxy-D-manno-octulosonate 8-phosphate phosphatase [Flavihumibacter petaseus NBRC 106054]